MNQRIAIRVPDSYIYRVEGIQPATGAHLESRLVTVSREARVQVFPNPLREAGTLQLPGTMGEAEVMLLDAWGHPLWQQPQQTTSSRLEFDLQGLAAGPYFLRVRTRSQSLTVKLQKTG
jgi:hypothetical protein